MRDLMYSIKNVAAHNRDGSYGTQHGRLAILRQAADHLHDAGYRDFRDAHNLKGRHVNALVARWRADGIAAATMKNRMSAVRWWAEKVGKSRVVPSNDQLGIERRVYSTNQSKAQRLDAEKLAGIRDARVALSLELQREFGLRREEAIKFQPAWADRGDHLLLKSSWCKGSKERRVPITSDSQRAVLDRAHALAGGGSLIRPDQQYVQQLHRYECETARVGLRKMHGLRHQFAQNFYRHFCGWQCTAAGGPRVRDLTPEQRAVDHQARLELSRVLGHEREQITTLYLGR